MLFGVILTVQVVAVFWLSPHQKTAVNQMPRDVKKVYLPGTNSSAPSLLVPPAAGVLANMHGFSGNAWLRFSNTSYLSPAYAEPARELAIAEEKLGGALVQTLSSNSSKTGDTSSRWEHSTIPIEPVAFDVPPRSWMEVNGNISRWASNSIPELKAQPSAEILRSSIVLVGVDDDGMVLSATLLPPKSGSPTADAEALALARSARFFKDPLRNPLEDKASRENPLHWGRLIFHWLTVPPPGTNADGSPLNKPGTSIVP